MEKIKSGFIKSSSYIHVSQMYFPALTKQKSNAMIARKGLNTFDPSIHAFVKYSAKVTVRKAREKEYSGYVNPWNG